MQTPLIADQRNRVGLQPPCMHSGWEIVNAATHTAAKLPPPGPDGSGQTSMNARHCCMHAAQRLVNATCVRIAVWCLLDNQQPPAGAGQAALASPAHA